MTIQIKEDNSLVQIPNPIIEYNTVDEAKASLGIDASIPTALPAGYESYLKTTISNTALDLTYVNGEKRTLVTEPPKARKIYPATIIHMNLQNC